MKDVGGLPWKLASQVFQEMLPESGAAPGWRAWNRRTSGAVCVPVNEEQIAQAALLYLDNTSHSRGMFDEVSQHSGRVSCSLSVGVLIVDPRRAL